MGTLLIGDPSDRKTCCSKLFYLMEDSVPQTLGGIFFIYTGHNQNIISGSGNIPPYLSPTPSFGMSVQKRFPFLRPAWIGLRILASKQLEQNLVPGIPPTVFYQTSITSV